MSVLFHKANQTSCQYSNLILAWCVKLAFKIILFLTNRMGFKYKNTLQNVQASYVSIYMELTVTAKSLVKCLNY
jgi:hypothetical protein